MAVNIQGDPQQISIGDGQVLIGDAGVTPTEDYGYLANATGISISRTVEQQDVLAGFPAVPVASFTTAVSVSVSFESLQWNLDNFARAGGGTRVTVPAVPPATLDQDCLGFGLSACPTEVTLQIIHCNPCTLAQCTFNFWRAQSTGALDFNLVNGQAHTFANEFRVLLATQDWAGNPLASQDGLFQLCCEIPV